MPQTFIVDQAATFRALAFLSAEPKVVYDTGKQETTKAGLPKWEIQLVAAFRDHFGKVNNEVVKVGYAGPRNPGDGLGMYQPVHLINFTVGVMDRAVRDKATGQEKIVGAQVWYRCDDIKPAAVAAPAGKGA